MTREQELAESLVARVGGVANIATVEHCVTRLRFVLHDPALADSTGIGALAGVVSVVRRAGQLQVVIGNEVADTYAAIEAMPGISSMAVDEAALRAGRPRSVRAAVNRALDLLMGTFQPLLWAMVGSSLVTTVVAVLVRLGWMDPGGPAYAVWSAAGDAVFAFLPVFVGISAARKLGANPFVGGTIAAALLADSYTSLGPVGSQVRVLGLPLQVIDYGSSVFPALIAAAMLAVLERRLRRVLPKDVHIIAVPAICIATLVPLTMFLFGPVGGTLSTLLSDGVGWLWSLSPAVAGFLMGGLWQVFVMLGIHWGFVPVRVNDITQDGYSLLSGPLLSAVLAQAAATLAVYFRTRNPELRGIAGGASISAFVAGVTEPAIYGVTLRLRRPFVYACVAGGVGGGIAAAGGSAALGFVFPGLVTLPTYAQHDGFGYQLVGVTVAVVGAFALTWFAGFRDPAPAETPVVAPVAAPDVATVAAAPAAPVAGVEPVEGMVHVHAPMTGAVVPLASVSDPVFARGMLGPGLAIVPTDGWVRSPVAGIVTSVARARHAVGVTSDEGADILVHVGLDTVTLGGDGFEVAVASGDRVSVGQVLLYVDLDKLTARGCDTTSPVVVTNAARFASVEVADTATTATGNVVIDVRLALADGE